MQVESDGTKKGMESAQETQILIASPNQTCMIFSWCRHIEKKEFEMGPTGCDSTCSMVTSSLHFAKISERLNTSYGFI